MKTEAQRRSPGLDGPAQAPMLASLGRGFRLGPNNKSCHRARAFTRIELVVILLVVALAVALIFSLINARGKGRRMQCISNLKQCALAYQMWGYDGRLPMNVSSQDGGTMGAPLAGNLWWQYSLLSNHITHPKTLLCPSDAFVTQVAIRWDNSPNGGFLNSNYRGNAISYALNLDPGSVPNPGTISLWMSSDQVLMCDRNFKASRYNNGCSGLPSGVKVAAAVLRNSNSSAVGWTNAVHGLTGNVSLVDGSAHFMGSKALFDRIIKSDDNGAVHFLLP